MPPGGAVTAEHLAAVRRAVDARMQRRHPILKIKGKTMAHCTGSPGPECNACWVDNGNPDRPRHVCQVAQADANPGCGCENSDECDRRPGCADARREALAGEYVKEGHSMEEAQRLAQAAPAPVAKPTNPKDAMGILKVAWSVIPLTVLWEVGVGMLEGALKYGRHNYLTIGVRASVYFDAAVARHLAAWWEGEDIDPDSGMSHITKAICSLVVLRAAMIARTWFDDRPPKAPPEHLAEMNARVKALLAKYPDPVAPYLANGKRGPGRRLEG